MALVGFFIISQLLGPWVCLGPVFLFSALYLSGIVLYKVFVRNGIRNC